MSNLEERKKKRKRQLGYWQRFSSDPDKEKDFFNRAMGNQADTAGEGGGESTGVGEGLSENSNNYRRVRNALFGDPKGRIKTFAIISAENPLGWKYSTEEEYQYKYRAWLNNPMEYNRVAREGIKSDVLADKVIKTGDDTLKHGHFNYTEIKGFYGEHEKTLMIYNIPLSDAKIIAGNYGQESFFWGKTSGDKSKIGYYFHTTPSCREYKLLEVSDTITLEDDATEFFSKYGIKFRVNMREFGDDVISPEYEDDFIESMDDSRTFMSRAHYRNKTKTMSNFEGMRAGDMVDDRRSIAESSTSRIFQHLTTDDTWAIVSPYRSERSEKENLAKMTELKADARKYGFIQFISRWVENGEAFDERSLLIPNISVEDALALGRKYDQSSVIVKDENGCREICTNPFETFKPGDVVRVYNIDGDKIMNISDAEEIFSKRRGGPASKPVKGGKAFHLSEVYEVEEPRPSYFQNGERLNLVLVGKVNKC